ncbi:helix-turn-helix transcriptional regulator [Pseudomonas sp. nanlin1]|uniref:LexA family transcriptional regulator n=1 Tax=Pseudomonas sp. nanlin1 TaxID=3040605 RepID=UPI003890D9F0
MNTSGDRLRVLLRECQLTAADFAAHRNVSPQHVNNWFRRGVPLARLDEIAELLSVEPRWLRTGEGHKYRDPLTPTLAAIASLAQSNQELDWASLAASDHSDALLPFFREQDGQLQLRPGHNLRVPLAILRSLGVESTRAIALAMPDNSMAERLLQGSAVAVESAFTHPAEGEPHALLHNGMLRLRTLYRLPGGSLRLRSYNHREYPDEILSAEDIEQQNLQVIGWAFWWSTTSPRKPQR